MKVIATIGSVLNSLIGFANSEVATEQNEKNIEICTQNLRAIGEAIRAYQKEHGDFPEWLSDLHPKHLADANTLICPADEEGGKTDLSMNTDPKMPVSYSYQFHPTYRDEKTEQRKVYGDAMPLVRCRHHENSEFPCINLSFSFKITRSTYVWEAAPEQLYGTPEEAIIALEAVLQQHPDIESLTHHVYSLLAPLYIKVGQKEQAIEYHLKAESSPELIGKSVPDFSLMDIDGNPISLRDYREKVILLDFWAVWCHFCIVEMPNLKKVYDTYNTDGFDVIGISLDNDVAEVYDYIKENGIEWRQILDAAISENSLVQQYGIKGIPAPWLIARDGTLISTNARGPLLEHLVAAAVKDKTVD